MEEQEVKGLIQKQVESCDEKYVLEKIYWQRTVRMIVAIVSLLITLFGGIIAWGFKTSTEVTNNTQGRRDLERRIDIVERQYSILHENNEILVDNQKRVLESSDRLGRKLDVLIDRYNK